MVKKFKINDHFSPSQFNQTDFGNIYHSTSRECREPETIEELARILKEYNQKEEQVTIRNTGHSTNGQTLTDGVQISLGKLKKIKFDEEAMEVTVEAGVSWHELMESIGLPRFCTPIFPNNPGQQIHVTGNAAVGGAGIFSSKYGGLWNLIKRIKVVTMTGEIIECSRDKNPEIFSYSLGGFGRIGVLAELTLPILASKEKVLGLLLVYHNDDELEKNVDRAMAKNLFDGVATVGPVNQLALLNKIGFKPNAMTLLKEVDKNENYIKEIVHDIKKSFDPHLMLYLYSGHKTESLDFSFAEHTVNKREIVYWYPNTIRYNQLNMCHPWSDHCVSKENYPRFANEVLRLINKYGMDKYVLKNSIFSGKIEMDVLGSYVVRKISSNSIHEYPLTLDLPESKDYYYGLVVQPTVPYEEVDRAMAMNKEITDLCYELGGRKYLYGTHDLTKEQVEKHFTVPVIEKWNKLKDELDPKHLLNIGVIEHLD